MAKTITITSNLLDFMYDSDDMYLMGIVIAYEGGNEKQKMKIRESFAEEFAFCKSLMKGRD